jgi:NADPH2:quinone reductase
MMGFRAAQVRCVCDGHSFADPSRSGDPGGWSEVIELVEDDVAEPAAGHVVVKVEAVALNHSESLARYGGKYAEGLPFPHDVGREGAGTVVAAGPDAGLAVGTRVSWFAVGGSCAEYVVAPAMLLVPIPDGLDSTSAALVSSAGGTASLLTRVWPLEGKSAAVWGAAGPTGRILAALLMRQGVDVIGIASGERVHIVRKLGVDKVVDRKSENVVEAVRAHTGGDGVAAVFDAVGDEAYEANIAMLGKRGCLINYGQLSGELPVVDLAQLMEAGSLFVTKLGGSAYFNSLADLTGVIRDTLEFALHNPAIVSEVAGTYPLAEVAEAYRHLETTHTAGY